MEPTVFFGHGYWAYHADLLCAVCLFDTRLFSAKESGQVDYTVRFAGIVIGRHGFVDHGLAIAKHDGAYSF